MKDYKGIYHNVEDNTKSYEYGAHFKYSELYVALKNLQIKQQNGEAPLEENNNNLQKENENKEEIYREKKRKKYRLKSLKMDENNRYFKTEANQKRNENNELEIIEDEEEDIKKKLRRRKSRLVTKVHLPKISSNNLISLGKNHLNTESNEKVKVHQSYDFNNMRRISFPKIYSLYKENMQENANNNIIVETQSIFDEKGGIKIYKDSNEKIPRKNGSNRKSKNKIFESEDKIELLPKSHKKKDRLKSIFDREKLIKNSNLFLGEKNNYTNIDKSGIVNNPISQQIYNLKKQIIGKKNF